jgi:hypothetical protein
MIDDVMWTGAPAATIEIGVVVGGRQGRNIAKASASSHRELSVLLAVDEDPTAIMQMRSPIRRSTRAAGVPALPPIEGK